VEDPRPGRFGVETADALGIPAGPDRGALQRGEAVTLPDGRVVAPESVLGEPRPGRKLAISADTAYSQAVVEAARDADVLVHEATFAEEEKKRARETLHSTAAEAAAVGRDAGVGLLALTHLSNRYFGGEIEREAQDVFPNTVVPRDLDIIVVPFQERGAPELVKGGASQKHGPSPLRGEAVAATIEEGAR
jgi:ribonuclease Z